MSADGSTPEPSTGFANQEFVDGALDRKRQEEAAREAETIELYGVARELFVNRILDTFEVERHGTEIEFYRSVDTTDVDRGTLREELDDDLFARITRGSDLLDQFEEAQLAIIEGARSGDADLTELLDESMDGVEIMREILACHAVDDSLTEPKVWEAMFRNEDRLSEVFEDFIDEGESGRTRQQLSGLQNLMSEQR